MKTNFMLKRSYAQAFGVFIAIIVSYFYAFSEKYWMVLAAIIVMQTVVSIPVRQGIQQLLIFLLIVVVGTYVNQSVSPMQCLILGIVIICLATVFEIRAWYFSILFFVALMSVPKGPEILQARVNDIGIGGAIGILTHLFIFPVRTDVEFRNSVMPFLTLYPRYLSSISDYILKKSGAEQQALLEKIRLEKMLQTQAPDWVYQAGLSLTLQPGHRHFLIMIERMSEILFSLHHIARHNFPAEIVQAFEKPLSQFVSEANAILMAMSAVFCMNKLDQAVSDLGEEWASIERTIRDLIPPTFEITDHEPNYFLLITLLENLKDLRQTLINLGNSLQTACMIK